MSRFVIVLALLGLISSVKFPILETLKFNLVDDININTFICFYWFIKLSLIYICYKSCYLIDTASTTSKHTKKTDTSMSNLLIIRTIAVMLVLFGHYFGHTYRLEDMHTYIRNNPLYSILCGAPQAGVWVFFTLSGYLMGKGFHSQRYCTNILSMSRFIKNRLLRIVPVYYFIVILCLLLYKPESIMVNDIKDVDRLLSLVFFDHSDSLVGALWSISTEVQFYALVPIIALIANHVKSKVNFFYFALFLAICVGVIKILIIKFLGFKYWYPLNYSFLLLNLDTFLIGFSIAYLRMSSNLILNNNNGILLISLAIYLAVVSVNNLIMINDTANHLRPIFFNGNIYLSFGPLIVALMIAFFAKLIDNGDLSEANFKKVGIGVGLIGNLSYVLYLVHEPIFLNIRRLLPDTIHPEIALGYSIPVFLACFVLAYFIYSRIELYYDARKIL